MRLNSEELDDACEQINGHTNWAYFDTLDAKEKKAVLKSETVVVFFEEPANEDGDYVIRDGE